MFTPDFSLGVYYHSFSVRTEQSAQNAILLFSKHGLLSRGEEFSAGNLTGELEYSFRYQHPHEIPILTGWSNKNGFIRRNIHHGMNEYGVTNNISVEKKGVIEEELIELLHKHPTDAFLQQALQNLWFKSRILPSGEFSWALRSDPHVQLLLSHTIADLIMGKTEIDDTKLKDIHIEELTLLLMENPQAILYSSESSLKNLATTIITGINRNLLAWELNELYYCTDQTLDFTVEKRQQQLARSLRRIKSYYLPHLSDTTAIKEHVAIVQSRAEAFGLLVEDDETSLYSPRNKESE